MDPNSLVLDISSDEDADHRNDHRGDDDDDDDNFNWFAELFGANESVKKSKLKDDLDDDDDCVVLDSDPNIEAVEVRNDDDVDDSDDVLVVSEKGQVACRDYPHSRHLCIKFPFSSTPNQSHCNQCYCYVCDSLAPCVYWGDGTATTDHCHATDKDEFWILERKAAKSGGKIIQPVTPPAPALARYHNQIPNAGLIHARHTLTNFLQCPGQYNNNLLATRNKLHPNLASKLVLRSHQKYNPGLSVHGPAFKRKGSVRVASTANQNPGTKAPRPVSKTTGLVRVASIANQNPGTRVHRPVLKTTSSVRVAAIPRQNPCRDIIGNHGGSRGSLQPNAVKNHVQYPSQSPINTCSTVNHQPLLHQPQVSGHSNPPSQSHVNFNPLTEVIPPLPFRPDSASSQPTYPVGSKPIVNTPAVPGLDLTLKSSQAQAPTGLKDCGLGGSMGQDSTNSLSFAGGLADYQYDWIFDDQPVEPGFTDYSSDYAFIDTGPIFDF